MFKTCVCEYCGGLTGLNCEKCNGQGIYLRYTPPKENYDEITRVTSEDYAKLITALKNLIQLNDTVYDEPCLCGGWTSAHIDGCPILDIDEYLRKYNL